MRDPVHILLVGAGHAHVQVLEAFAKTPEPGIRLTLVTPAARTPYSGMLPGFVAGHYAREDLEIDLVRLARFAGARLVLGAEIEKIETFGTYNCRPIAGLSKLSEHAHSNAIDVSAFVLSDGRRITVQQGWHGDRQTRQFLSLIHASACKRFSTVLSPDYNAAHHDHFHFDMGGRGGFCR